MDSTIYLPWRLHGTVQAVFALCARLLIASRKHAGRQPNSLQLAMRTGNEQITESSRRMRLAAPETNHAMGTQSTSDAVQCRITVADTRSIRSLGFAINMQETVRGVGCL
jgi:hypothetical protein